MAKAELYKRFPVTSVILYNGTTVLHFLLGSAILLCLHRFFGPFAFVVAVSYFLFSFLEMYVVMPFRVCRHCVYFRLENGICISGLNVLARRMAKTGNQSDFPNRAKGIFCPNNLYVFSLILPVVSGIPILISNYSRALLCCEISIVALLAARFLYIIPKLACVHCLSKFECPQAGQMGVRDK